MKLTVNIDKIKEAGILYVLIVELEDKELIKVGVTCRDKLDDRLAEIVLSIWKKYRWIPRTYAKRFRKTDDVYGKEAELHRLLDEYRYETQYKFSGSTEMFDVCVDKVVELYEKVISKSEEDNKSVRKRRTTRKTKDSGGRSGTAGVDEFEVSERGMVQGESKSQKKVD